MQISIDASSASGEVHRRPQTALETVAKSIPSPDEARDLAELFRLLGDPTRVRILYALLDAEELCVCDVAVVVGTSETKVSQAMRLLRSAGVVRNRRDGRNVFYRLDDLHVELLLGLTREHLAHSSEQLLPTAAEEN